MAKKKKWYQTGEFEDGYQFGDGLRTLKNVVKKNIESLKTSKNDKKVSQDKKEVQTKNKGNAIASLTRVENGRLKIDPAVRLYGFENEVERQNFVNKTPKSDSRINNIKTLDNKVTDALVNSAKRKSSVGEKLTVAEYGAVKSTNTTLVTPKNRSEAYNLFKMEQLKSKAKKYTLLMPHRV